MGRRKIEIKTITNERNRSVTFLKRKNGLFKKAYELGVLCSVDVEVIIFGGPVGQKYKLFEYCSGDADKIVKKRLNVSHGREKPLHPKCSHCTPPSLMESAMSKARKISETRQRRVTAMTTTTSKMGATTAMITTMVARILSHLHRPSRPNLQRPPKHLLLHPPRSHPPLNPAPTRMAARSKRSRTKTSSMMATIAVCPWSSSFLSQVGPRSLQPPQHMPAHWQANVTRAASPNRNANAGTRRRPRTPHPGVHYHLTRIRRHTAITWRRQRRRTTRATTRATPAVPIRAAAPTTRRCTTTRRATTQRTRYRHSRSCALARCPRGIRQPRSASRTVTGTVTDNPAWAWDGARR
ncbi:hypothetical protein BKA62DRAFT_712663 [Auriculariales sp. MPI-PUGE-AT-0066]|nr:hypothetical protein BKA62DRAFT_712663 [Auriculariales sp. MPI-PUGE-AT-0066]